MVKIYIIEKKTNRNVCNAFTRRFQSYPHQHPPKSAIMFIFCVCRRCSKGQQIKTSCPKMQFSYFCQFRCRANFKFLAKKNANFLFCAKKVLSKNILPNFFCQELSDSNFDSFFFKRKNFFINYKIQKLKSVLVILFF